MNNFLNKNQILETQNSEYKLLSSSTNYILPLYIIQGQNSLILAISDVIKHTREKLWKQ